MFGKKQSNHHLTHLQIVLKCVVCIFIDFLKSFMSFFFFLKKKKKFFTLVDSTDYDNSELTQNLG